MFGLCYTRRTFQERSRLLASYAIRSSIRIAISPRISGRCMVHNPKSWKWGAMNWIDLSPSLMMTTSLRFEIRLLFLFVKIKSPTIINWFQFQEIDEEHSEIIGDAVKEEQSDLEENEPADRHSTGSDDSFSVLHVMKLWTLNQSLYQHVSLISKIFFAEP